MAAALGLRVPGEAGAPCLSCVRAAWKGKAAAWEDEAVACEGKAGAAASQAFAATAAAATAASPTGTAGFALAGEVAAAAAVAGLAALAAGLIASAAFGPIIRSNVFPACLADTPNVGCGLLPSDSKLPELLEVVNLLLVLLLG